MGNSNLSQRIAILITSVGIAVMLFSYHYEKITYVGLGSAIALCGPALLVWVVFTRYRQSKQSKKVQL
jgi:hypothetical protein